MSSNPPALQPSNPHTFWHGQKVFLTGNTGFKGSWLSIWLHALGAKVYGYALKPNTNPSLYELCALKKITKTTIGDVRDAVRLQKAVLAAKPDIIIHMAAQPLVRLSYKDPRETYETNVMGTINLLEAARKCSSVRAIVNVTTDKCYENKEHLRGYKEDEPLGGYDPYSSSKACSELVTSAYRSSFFNPKNYSASLQPSNPPTLQPSLHHIALASARAGNVIGGGDWAADRLIPDIIRAALKGEKVHIRNPRAIRPWQHVLEPLNGYLMLAEKLYKHGPRYAQAWNFGPDAGDAKNVEWIVRRMFRKWPEAPGYAIDKGPHPHEAHYLKLDSSKARKELHWAPRWHIGRAIDKIIEWTIACERRQDMREVCIKQIEEYCHILS
ncbi:MAG: CDP-glucose 4,6-dehydratase [Elusimicrobiales bacterium]|jgi:CDP-glucose 4,6-dehydratase